MKLPRKSEETQEESEVMKSEEKREGVAVFFDLDGTLVALPSLERRFFRALRYRRAIPARSYFLWFREALRLMPRGISTILQANKMYLCSVQILNVCGHGDEDVSAWHKGGHQAKGQASAPPRRNPRLPVPAFFAQAIERVAWHARHGHEIVLISGTLEPLARGAARAMEAELAARGIRLTIRAIGTRLEEVDGRWTGRILGEPMFGQAKSRAAKRLAEQMRLDLGRCYAYGDSLTDRWLMELVGRPAAVNPSASLARIALERGWPMLIWGGKGNQTQRREVREEIERREQSNALA